MPSVVKSLHWFVRVNGTQEFLAQKVSILSVETALILAVYHIGSKGENSHCHFVLTLPKELQKQSFDVKLKKVFGVTGNGEYSSKPWDGVIDEEGAGSYLFHESIESPILIQKGISAEQVSKLKATALIVNKVVDANRQKAETKIPAKVIEKWIAGGKGFWNNQEIVSVICHMARDGECYLPKGDFQWKAYVEEIKMRMCESPAEFDEFCFTTYQRLYRFS